MADETSAAARKTNVFISYSRRDAEMADRLHAQLTAEGLNPYLDKHDIAAGEDWKERLGGLIESADTMVFVITPDSIASSVCDWEVNHAELLGKRIIPVVAREPGEGVPERLQRLNYVFMRNPEEEQSALPRLADALAVDIAWVRNHTRYGELAREWDKAGRPARLLLRGASIAEAERWRDGRPATAPQLTELQSAYIAASRRGATTRQRGWLAGSVAVAALAIGLSVYAFFQQQAAEASRAETATVLATSDLRQGTLFADEPEAASNGIAYLARAAGAGDARAQTRLWTMLQQRSFWLPASETPSPAPEPPPLLDLPDDVIQRFSEVDVDGTLVPTQNIAISGDGSRVFTAVGDVVEDVPVRIRVWNRDGTPVTDWWEPFYSGDFYLYRVRGFLSETGRYLAVELEGWRETASLLVYDFDVMKELETDIVASGLVPQTQSIGFSSVRFVEPPAAAGEEPVVYLLTASAKGDAVAYMLAPDSLSEIARNSHRAAVTASAIDVDTGWLMSGAADRTVLVSALHDLTSVGNLVQVESQPTALQASGTSGLLIRGETGEWSGYDLKAPIGMQTADVPPLDVQGARQEACLRLGDPQEEQASGLEHPSGLVLSAEDGRRVGVARAGGAKALSPPFAADIHTVCANAAGTIVSVTTSDFRTEFWASDFSRRIGPGFSERSYFTPGSTPEKTDWVSISTDGRQALIRSSLWVPPNLELFWISLWDIESGLPLMDRMSFNDDGLTDGLPKSAMFAPGGGITLVGDKAYTPQTLTLSAPPGLPAALPAYAEAIANQTITDAGLAEAVPDRNSRLTEGSRLIDNLLK